MSVREAILFDRAREKAWPRKPRIDESTHCESMQQLFKDLSQQRRESPWYSFFVGTVMPHIRAIYSGGSSQLQLECFPQFELHYRHPLTGEVMDPTWRAPPSSANSDVASGAKTDDVRVSRELQRLLVNTLDGSKWRQKSPKGKTRSETQAQKKPEPVKTDESTISSTTITTTITTTSATSTTTTTSSTSASTSTPPPPTRNLLRVTDAMFSIRAVLSSFQKSHPNETRVPFLPSIGVEVKVPLIEPTKQQLASRNFEIDEWMAGEALTHAMPQIVQQAQFMLHGWPSLKIVWMIEPELIQNGEYFISTPEMDADEVAEDTSDVIQYIQDDGSYSAEFTDAFKIALKDSQTEYNRFIGNELPEFDMEGSQSSEDL
ncbi:hypothetical protein ONZ45_g12432 [Pleurotus djamor]|nr:hypothetical protein ONZ45_g12432 [Pleurotus djamor]